MLKGDAEFDWTCRQKTMGKRAVVKRRYVKGRDTILRVYGNALDPRNAQNLRSTGNNPILICWDEGTTASSRRAAVFMSNMFVT